MVLGAANDALLMILGVVFVIVAVTLIAFSMFRQSDGGGVGAAFGGGDGGGALGTKGQQVVDKVIAFLGFCFIVLALAYSLISTGGRASDTEAVPTDTSTEAPKDAPK
ncbi:MAG: preprotein translocase subunit SecG [Planctomycetes bacterium]|nr:preprotein translocase subunit SecG [Planctomycetota bacterium]